MNREYMKLSNGNTIVTDENGHITERNDNVNKDLLILENKIEILTKEQEKVEKDIYEQARVKRLSKNMLIGMPIVLLGLNTMFFIAGGIAGDGSFIEAGYQALVPTLTADVLTLGVTIPYFSLFIPISNKKIKKLNKKKEKIKELSKKYDKELTKVKEESKTKEETITIEPISLVHKTNIEQKEITKQLQKAYSPKKRVLKK